MGKKLMLAVLIVCPSIVAGVAIALDAQWLYPYIVVVTGIVYMVSLVIEFFRSLLR
jgi:hypothetical protein